MKHRFRLINTEYSDEFTLGDQYHGGNYAVSHFSTANGNVVLEMQIYGGAWVTAINNVGRNSMKEGLLPQGTYRIRVPTARATERLVEVSYIANR